MKRNLVSGDANKWKFLQEVAKPYALDILGELNRDNRRFSELKSLCKSQKTLTVRLYELEELGAIKKIIETPKKSKIIVFYTITEKGKKILHLAEGFLVSNN